jgi:WhiB family transcriptional regulator, redox-sensing transcriptional regulator
MNAYEILASFAEALHCEYEAYNLPGALQDLEDRVINAEVNAVVHPHPATQQDTEIEPENEPELEGPPSASKKSSWVTDWTPRAACKGMDPDELFVQGRAQNRVKLICRGCPVRTECLADALDNGIEFGVWGGLTERERRMLLRRRPDVTSWRELLERARQAYEQRAQQEAAAGSGYDASIRPHHDGLPWLHLAVC